MIINTGMRTDIPAFYSEWFFRRIKEKYVLVRNPYYPQQVTHYSLSPDIVDCLCFCTKNPCPMLHSLWKLSDYHQFWFVTITPYGKEIEPYVPDTRIILKGFRSLSEQVGCRAVSLRYDPIFLSEKYNVDFHINIFEKMCRFLEGYTEQCVISFIDLYEKTKRNFPGAREVSWEDRVRIVKAFSEIGSRHSIVIHTCCEGNELGKYGANVSGCMTKEILEHAIGMELHISGGKRAQREGCNCLLGSDIGEYNTCGHGCIYCYANASQDKVRQKMRDHDKASPLLIGHLRPEDEVRIANQEKYRTGQITLF